MEKLFRNVTAKMSTDIRFNSNTSAPQLQLTNKRHVRQGERRPFATSIYFRWFLTSLLATFPVGGVVKPELRFTEL